MNIWKPINEFSYNFKENKHYLVYDKDYGIGIAYAELNGIIIEWYIYKINYRIRNVTHYMELPDEPCTNKSDHLIP